MLFVFNFKGFNNATLLVSIGVILSWDSRIYVKCKKKKDLLVLFQKALHVLFLNKLTTAYWEKKDNFVYFMYFFKTNSSEIKGLVLLLKNVYRSRSLT